MNDPFTGRSILVFLELSAWVLIYHIDTVPTQIICHMTFPPPSPPPPRLSSTYQHRYVSEVGVCNDKSQDATEEGCNCSRRQDDAAHSIYLDSKLFATLWPWYNKFLAGWTEIECTVHAQPKCPINQFKPVHTVSFCQFLSGFE